MDEKDKIIINLLLDNSKLSSQTISKKTGIPLTTVYHRIKKLEKEGIIEKYTIKINPQKIGKNLSAYILAAYNLSQHAADGRSSSKIITPLKNIPQITEVSFITGSYDMIIKVR